MRLNISNGDRRVALEHFKKQVLLLHSEQSTLDNLSAGFNDRYTVHCATSGSEAIRLFTEHQSTIRVVLLDMSMPVLSGIETMDELRRLAPGLKVILSSGHTEAQARAKVDGTLVDGFLKKPYGPSDLIDCVDSVLNG